MRIVIAGSGITLYFLAKRFISKGYQVSIISDQPDDCDYYARNLKALVIQGSNSDPELLSQAETHSAEIFIGMASRDQDNLVLCQIAREYYGVPHILAVVNDPDNEAVFRQMGVRAVSHSRLLLETIESMSTLGEIKQQFSAVEGKVMLTELEVPPNAHAAGKRLMDLALPGAVLVATILRGDEVLIPQGGTVIMAGDRLLLLTLLDNQAIALKIFS